MIPEQFKQKLIDLGACSEAKEWADGKSWQEVFDTCPRGDWMLWLFRKTSVTDEASHRLLFLAKAECAATVQHLMKDQRSIDAVQAARDYGLGKIGKEELQAAAADAAYAARAAYDAYAAADAAYAYAAAAYAAAAAAAALTRNQQLTADICRRILTFDKWQL